MHSKNSPSPCPRTDCCRFFEITVPLWCVLNSLQNTGRSDTMLDLYNKRYSITAVYLVSLSRDILSILILWECSKKVFLHNCAFVAFFAALCWNEFNSSWKESSLDICPYSPLKIFSTILQMIAPFFTWVRKLQVLRKIRKSTSTYCPHSNHHAKNDSLYNFKMLSQSSLPKLRFTSRQ